MTATRDKIPGVSVDVDDLIALRAELTGLNKSRLRQRNRSHAGLREIRLRGRGMEYEESRAYVYGDDVRTMDWRVMARTGEAHTKLFAEEKDRCSLIAVDLSPSMFFGTRFAFKSWTAAHLAAYLGWLAVLGDERVGGVVSSNAHHAEIRPGKSRSGLLGIFHHLAQADSCRQQQVDGDNRLNRLLGDLRRMAQPGTDIALISDFIGADDSTRNALSALSRSNRVFHYWIHDTSETDAWMSGRYALRDGQGSAWLDLHDPQQQQRLAQRQSEHTEAVEALSASFNIPLLPINSSAPIFPQLLQALQS